MPNNYYIPKSSGSVTLLHLAIYDVERVHLVCVCVRVCVAFILLLASTPFQVYVCILNVWVKLLRPVCIHTCTRSGGSVVVVV